MQTLLDICNAWGEERGMEFCGDKSGFMAFGKERKEEFRLSVGDVEVGRVKEYEYLGVCLSELDDYMAAMKNKIIKKTARVKGIIKHTGLWGYSRYEVVRILWKMVAVPGATFANEVLTLGRDTQKQLEHFQDEVGRWAIGANRFTAGEVVQGDLGWSSFEAREAKSKINFFGRIKFMNEDRVVKIIFNYLRNWVLRETNWIRRVRELFYKFFRGVELGDVLDFKTWKATTKEVVEEVETEMWHKRMEAKTSTALYRIGKDKISWEDYHEGD